MTPTECAGWLLGHDDYLILSHIRPDGDTLGSGAALVSALRRAGKRAYCARNPQLIDTYAPFVAPYLAAEGFAHKTLVAVDIADEGLIPDGQDGEVALCIDHHPSNTRYAKSLCLNAGASACGELVLEIIKALGNGVTKAEADLLYIAVSTDTGCFMYMNTNADTHIAAAELIGLGAEAGVLNNLLFRTMSRARLLLEGMIMSGLRFYRDGKICVAEVTLDMLERSGATDNDCEDLAGIAGRAAGNVISITLRELEGGKCKVSMRSKPEVNVSDICAVFGGGGHAMASGCTIMKGVEPALAELLAAIDEKWPA